MERNISIKIYVTNQAFHLLNLCLWIELCPWNYFTLLNIGGIVREIPATENLPVPNPLLNPQPPPIRVFLASFNLWNYWSGSNSDKVTYAYNFCEHSSIRNLIRPRKPWKIKIRLKTWKTRKSSFESRPPSSKVDTPHPGMGYPPYKVGNPHRR